jgi:hypothetical protein
MHVSSQARMHVSSQARMHVSSQAHSLLKKMQDAWGRDAGALPSHTGVQVGKSLNFERM